MADIHQLSTPRKEAKRPVGLNTVQMLKACSSRLGMSPAETMRLSAAFGGWWWMIYLENSRCNVNFHQLYLQNRPQFPNIKGTVCFAGSFITVGCRKCEILDFYPSKMHGQTVLREILCTNSLIPWEPSWYSGITTPFQLLLDLLLDFKKERQWRKSADNHQHCRSYSGQEVNYDGGNNVGTQVVPKSEYPRLIVLGFCNNDILRIPAVLVSKAILFFFGA